MTDFIRTTLPDPKKRKKSKQTYSEILRRGHPYLPKRKLYGGQDVPMDLDKINASFEQTRKPKE